MPYRLIIFLATVIGGTLLLAPWPPLGVAGEWVWPRQELPSNLLDALDRLIWPLVCGSAVVAFCAWGERRIDNVGRIQRGLLVLGLTGLSFLWLNSVRQAAPSPHREGTHPPGLLLLNRGLLRLTKSSPATVQFSEALQNRGTVHMFREVEALSLSRIARPLSKSEFAALHLSSLLSTLFAAMAVIPVFGLTRRLTDSKTAWRAAASV